MADGSTIKFAGGPPKEHLIQSSIFLEKPHYILHIHWESFGELLIGAKAGSRFEFLTASANCTTRGGNFTIETGLTMVEGVLRH